MTDATESRTILRPIVGETVGTERGRARVVSVQQYQCSTFTAICYTVQYQNGDREEFSLYI